MSSIVLVMWRKGVAECLLATLNKEPGLRLYYEQDYSRAGASIQSHEGNVALIEAAETGACDVAYCLEVCASLRKETENCKLILMCPDQDEEAVAQTVGAKQDGRIDDFLFYGASFDYVSSKLLAMLQK